MRSTMALFALALCAACVSPANARESVGSGLSGNADGARAGASFMGPRGVAYDSAGNLFVADAAGQRIRRIAPSGAVTTIAGGGEPASDHVMVLGAYRDGPAAAARFNRPSALVVDADGTVYVADTDNHCIRAIRAGVVTTFAGANERGSADGPRALARFVSPSALALDSAGRLFVADHRNAVRVIDRNGSVSTLKLPGDLVNFYSGISVWGSGADEHLIIATHFGAMIVSYPGLRLEHLYHVEPHPPFTASDGSIGALHRSIGYPFALAALGPQTFVASDPRAHAVRIYDGERTTILAGAGRENSQQDSPGFSEAPNYRFFSPTGIALAKDGTLAIADTGNRSIRFLQLPALRGALTSATVRAGATARTILVAGDRWYTQTPLSFESVAGLLGRRAGTRADVQAYFAGNTLAQQIDGLKASAARPGAIKAIVWMLNADNLNADVGRPAGTPLDSQSIGPLRARVASVGAWARQNHIRLITLILPTAAQASPAAMLWASELSATPAPQFDGFAADEAFLRGLFEGAGPGLIDAFPAFLSDQRSASPHLLFGTQDPALTRFASGRAADLIASALRAAGLL